MFDKPVGEKVRPVPLVVDCQVSMRSNPDPVGPGVAPTLTAQLESLGGEIYCRCELDPRRLLLVLAAWEPLCEAIKGSNYPERPKSQWLLILGIGL